MEWDYVFRGTLDVIGNFRDDVYSLRYMEADRSPDNWWDKVEWDTSRYSLRSSCLGYL